MEESPMSTCALFIYIERMQAKQTSFTLSLFLLPVLCLLSTCLSSVSIAYIINMKYQTDCRSNCSRFNVNKSFSWNNIYRC